VHYFFLKSTGRAAAKLQVTWIDQSSYDIIQCIIGGYIMVEGFASQESPYGRSVI